MRILSKSPDESPHVDSLYTRRINHLMKNWTAKDVRYLEIGVERGHTFESVRAGEKVGVDPSPMFNVQELPEGAEFFSKESDDFFSGFAGEKFDVVFVDGLHECHQTYRDIIHAFANMKEGSVCVVDDVGPTDYASSLPSLRSSTRAKKLRRIRHRRWYGDVYRAICAISECHPEIGIKIVGDPKASHSWAILYAKEAAGLVSTSARAEETMTNLSFREVFQTARPNSPYNQILTDSDFFSFNSLEALCSDSAPE